MLSRWTGGELVRLQCYEGLDVAQAVYEWDYSRQLLHLRAAEAAGKVGPDATTDALEDELYSERFLVRRPLLRAIDHGEGPPPVLLIDEVDRADDEFEAFLLEVLSDYSITVPELGTFRAAVPPLVVITSNRTRDVHDALKRRCLYHWVDHPDFEREVAIVRLRAPDVPEPPRSPGRRGRRVDARARPLQAARRRGDDRLGDGARRARTRRRSTIARCGDARHRAEVSRGRRARADARHRRARARGRRSGLADTR